MPEYNPNLCWDCGSSKPGHHTEHCELSATDAIRDLPEVDGSQYWTESPAGRALALTGSARFHPLTGVVVNSQTRKPGAGAFIGDA